MLTFPDRCDHQRRCRGCPAGEVFVNDELPNATHRADNPLSDEALDRTAGTRSIRICPGLSACRKPASEASDSSAT